MSETDAASDLPCDSGDTVVALPLWAIGGAAFVWGLLRGRPLLMALGAAAFFADRDAKPVVRARDALAELRGLR
jgi:hypothetical protein